MSKFNEASNEIDLISHEFKNTYFRSDSTESSLLRQCDNLLPLKVDGFESHSDLSLPGVKPFESGRKGKKKKSKKSKKANKIEGCRGVDTLLRSAYRTQLDMLSLVTVKANIMISLNGLLISMLIISGTHFIGVNGLYSIPIALFLLSSALATVFAVLAAQPDISRKRFSLEDFKNGNAHLLAFEEFSDLSEKEYVGEMTIMLGDNDRVYKSMVSHIHELGSMADRKYHKLHCSYSVFIGGIILATLSILTLGFMGWLESLSTQVAAGV